MTNIVPFMIDMDELELVRMVVVDDLKLFADIPVEEGDIIFFDLLQEDEWRFTPSTQMWVCFPKIN